MGREQKAPCLCAEYMTRILTLQSIGPCLRDVPKNTTGLFHCWKHLETKGSLNVNRNGKWEVVIKINIHKNKDAQHLHRSKILWLLRQERDDKRPENNRKMSGYSGDTG